MKVEIVVLDEGSNEVHAWTGDHLPVAGDLIVSLTTTWRVIARAWGSADHVRIGVVSASRHQPEWFK